MTTTDEAAERLTLNLDRLQAGEFRESWLNDLRILAGAYLSERPQLLAEVERLGKEKENLEAFMRVQVAKAQAFDWLVEWNFSITKLGDDFVVLDADNDAEDFVMGRGTTPLEAIEDAKRRSG